MVYRVIYLTLVSELLFRNYKNMTSFGKYFVFGNTSTTMKMSFTWFDSFDKRKITS